MTLTVRDIHSLASDPLPNVRANIAGKLSQAMEQRELSLKEMDIALEILELLARDIEVQVRVSVAEALKESIGAPHDLILRLANDITDVALPVLQYSCILTEEDLIHIVDSTNDVVKLEGIARRESISEALSEALVSKHDDSVAHTVLLNSSAAIGEETFDTHFDFLTHASNLTEILVRRGNLPIAIAEKLFAVVTDELKHHLAHTYQLPMAIVEDNIEDIREWATLGMLIPDADEQHIDEHELEGLIQQLYSSNRLTYSMVIRALCGGDLAFFETAMAQFADVPRANARILMFDSGPYGFQAFYERSKMPPAFFEAIKVLLKLSLELTTYGRIRREDFRARMIERIRQERYDHSIENMQYLLTIMSAPHSRAEPAAASAH